MNTKELRLRSISKRQLRDERMLLIGLIVGFITAMIVCMLTLVIMHGIHKVELTHYGEEIIQLQEEHEAELKQLQEEVDKYKQQYEELDSNYQSDISEQEETIQKLQKEIEDDSLLDFTLAKRYYYVIKEAPENGGVTLDLIKFTDDLCAEKNVNPHLVWAIVDVESDYNTTAASSKSTARGLGQFLASTGKIFYEDSRFMNRGTYSHDYAYDPYINIEMMIWYLEYLSDSYGADLLTMLQFYSGDTGGKSYYNKVVAELNQYNLGMSVTYPYYNTK